MTSQLTWHVGNRNPSITENLVNADGTPVDLTAKTVQFRAREPGATSLLVDQPATVVGAATLGNVQYDWSIADVTAPAGALSAPRDLLVWWVVTSGVRTQDYAEALIRVDAHASPGYLDLEEFKASLELSPGAKYIEKDARVAIAAASRAVDWKTGLRFYPDPDATAFRYFSPRSRTRAEIDPLVTLGAGGVSLDSDGNGTYDVALVSGTDYVLEPRNAPADGQPYTRVRMLPTASIWMQPCYPNSVRVQGQFGFARVPEGVKVATGIIATRLVLRLRQAPFGVLSGGVDGAAIRISRYDPDVDLALASVGGRQVLA
jgi:hypothetical protein